MRFEPGLIGEIRKHRAQTSYLVAYDDTETELEKFHLTKHRQTCSQAVAAFKDLAWSSVRFYDGKDGIVHSYKRQIVDEEPPGELETITPPGTSRMAELNTIAQLVARSNAEAVKTVLAEVRFQTQPMMQVITDLLDRQTARDEARERIHERAMNAVHRLSMDLAQAHATLAGVEKLREFEQTIQSTAPASGTESGDALDQVWAHVGKKVADRFLDDGTERSEPDKPKAPNGQTSPAEHAPPPPTEEKPNGQPKKPYVNKSRAAFRARNGRAA